MPNEKKKYTKEEVLKLRAENRTKLDQEFNTPQRAAIEIIMLLNDIKFLLLKMK